MQYNELCTNLGLKVKYYRQCMKLTQAELSEKTAIDVRYISDIERGKKNITLKTLHKLTTALNINPEDLFIFPNHKTK